MLPCERIFLLENRQFSQHRPQEVMPKKCHLVNVFFFENGQFPRDRHQEVMQYLAYVSYVLLKRMARAARNFFDI